MSVDDLVRSEGVTFMKTNTEHSFNTDAVQMLENTHKSLPETKEHVRLFVQMLLK